MKKIEFVNGTTIDGAQTFNQIQSNVEEVFNGEEAMGSIRVDDISCKNLFNINNAEYRNGNNVYSGITSTGIKAVSHGDISEAAYTRYNLIDLRGLEGKTITLSWIAKTNRTDDFRNFVAELYYTDGSSTSELITWTAPNEFSFTVKENLGNLYLLAGTFIANRAGNTFKSGEYVEFADIQIELGDEATTYVPYKKFGYNDRESMGKIVVDDISCKNLLKNIAKSKTENGVTFTVNSDGSVHVSGTATANTFLRVTPLNFYLPAGMYTLSGGYVNSSTYLAYQGQHSDGSYFNNAVRANGSREFEVVDGDIMNFIQIRISSGTTIDYTFKPQLEKGTIATEFTPYKEFGYTSGSNDNGSWVKYDDGRMECRKKMTFSETPITTPIGSLFESASLTIGDFPIPFVGDYPDVFIMPCGMFFVERYPSDSLTSYGKFRACKPTSAESTDVTVSILAIGRWKDYTLTSTASTMSLRPDTTEENLEDEII